MTLYEDRDFRGRGETFLGDDPFLGDNPIGQDRASSVQVAPGCEVTLYAHSHYRGASTTLRYHQNDLRYSQVGGDSVSSLRVRCGRGDWGQPDQPGYGAPGPSGYGQSGWGVTLYEDHSFRGHGESFAYDDPDLDDNRIGEDNASSVRIAPGCWVRLYEDRGFRGRYVDLAYDIPDLRSTALGTDRASSLRVSCAGDWLDNFQDIGQRGRVTLYEDSDFRGRRESFVYDDPELGDNLIGRDRASSVQVEPGCRVRLFEDSDFRGRYVDLAESVRDLRYTPLGGDSVSSLHVVCDPQRPDFLSGQGPHRGVTLFRDSHFRGRHETFVYDDASLEDNHIDHDSASSVRVDPGCRARLYVDTGFRGRYVDVSRDIPDLRQTPVGTDEVSSLRVRCFTSPWDR
ncbi:MAG TPA: beta/gamma crystallin-related protein [Acidobacteriota bacterium]